MGSPRPAGIDPARGGGESGGTGPPPHGQAAKQPGWRSAGPGPHRCGRAGRHLARRRVMAGRAAGHADGRPGGCGASQRRDLERRHCRSFSCLVDDGGGSTVVAVRSPMCEQRVVGDQHAIGVKVASTRPACRLRVVGGSPCPTEHMHFEYTTSSCKVPAKERHTDARTSPPPLQTDRCAQPRARIARTYSTSITKAVPRVSSLDCSITPRDAVSRHSPIPAVDSMRRGWSGVAVAREAHRCRERAAWPG